ncbi:hypothetical protein SNK03_003655 [Fusarium graminearum]
MITPPVIAPPMALTCRTRYASERLVAKRVTLLHFVRNVFVAIVQSVTTTPLANALSTISYALHVDERSITILTAPHPPVASGAARASAPRASALSTISYVLYGDERATLLQLHHTRKGPVVHKTRDVWTHTIPMSSINLDHCRLLSDLADLDLRLASHSNLLKELLGVGNAMSGLATEVVRDEMIREEFPTAVTALRLRGVVSRLKHNDQVETFCQRLTRTFEDWGFSEPTAQCPCQTSCAHTLWLASYDLPKIHSILVKRKPKSTI